MLKPDSLEFANSSFQKPVSTPGFKDGIRETFPDVVLETGFSCPVSNPVISHG
jgi:hypothetical protein